MTDAFVRTETILDKILAYKQDEIAAKQAAVPLEHMRTAATSTAPPRNLLSALRRDTIALIAEVKHASPSQGILIEDFDPVGLGTTYARHGAAAVSVLTDEQFFKGHLDDLRAVRGAVTVPVLRKDFIIDAYQVYDTRAAGADAALLIVATLTDAQLADLHAQITALGMAALVEVHNEAEMERALALSAPLIGVNNRDLKTFKVDLDTIGRLSHLVPEEVTLVAESGIRDARDVYRMGNLGAHAVLVGESLVKADNIAIMVSEFSTQKREVFR